MKLGAIESLKFKKLKMRLGLTQWQAIGLLESLWMFTSRNAPLGDIGKHSNEDIAVHLEWMDDPDGLIDALVECRWIDRCDEHRLLIHDWADHLPKWLEGNLKSHKKQPILPKPQVAKQAAMQVAKQPAIAPCSEHPAIFSSDLISSDTPSSDTHGGVWLEGKTPEFKIWWQAYPRRQKQNLALTAWRRAVRQIVDDEGLTETSAIAFLLSATLEYAESPAGSEPRGSKDVRPLPSNWLDAGSWKDDRKTWQIPNGFVPNAREPTKPVFKPLPKDDLGDNLMEMMK